MKLLILLVFLSNHAVWATNLEKEKEVSIQGDIKLPENYHEHKERLKHRDQIIPMAAAKATSPGAFSGKILEYHLADIIKNNQFKPLESMKSLEQSVNKNTSIESKNFKMKSKLDLNRLQARIDIETFVNTHIWTEDSFKTLRSQMELYRFESGMLDNGFLSLENKASNEDTRTYFNFKKTW